MKLGGERALLIPWPPRRTWLFRFGGLVYFYLFLFLFWWRAANHAAPGADCHSRRSLFAEVRKLVRIGAIHCPESLDTKQRVSRLHQRFPEFSHTLANGALRLEAGNSVLAAKRLQQLQNARIRLCESPTAVAPSCVCM